MKHFLLELHKKVNTHQISVRSAALAYYALFAFAPMLLILVMLGDTVLDIPYIQTVIFNQIIERIGPNAASILQKIELRSAGLTANLTSAVIGVSVALYGAINFFVYLRKSFITIFSLQTKSLKHNKAYNPIIRYIRAFVYMLVLLIPATIAIALNGLFSTIAPQLSSYINSFSQGNYINLLVSTLTSIPAMVAFFMILYVIVSGGSVSWKSSFLGSIVASILLFVLNIGLKIYLSISIIISLFGAAGSVIILLLWLYYSIQIILIGAIASKIHNQHLANQTII